MASAVSGDSAYITEARRIQENVRQLAEISSELNLPNITATDVHARLKEARSLAIETHGMLKRLNIATTAVDLYSIEKGQRRLTHKQLKTQYQAALKAIDTAAQISLGVAPQPSGAVVESASLPLGYDSDSRSSTASSHASHKLPHSVRYPSRGPDPLNANGKQYNRLPNTGSRIYSQPYSSSSHSQPEVQPSSQFDIYKVGYPQPMTGDFPLSVGSVSNRQYIPSGGGHVELMEAYGTNASTSAGVPSTSTLSRQELECFSPLQQKLITPQQQYAPSYESARQVEKDVRGIRELYKEMAWQVSHSADDLDAIECQMRSAVSFTQQSTQQLTAANADIRSRRRFLFIAASTVFVTSLVLLLLFKILF